MPLEAAPVIKPEVELKPEKQREETTEKPPLSEPFAVQLIVENLGGFLSQDAVRLDGDMLSRWEKMFPGRKIHYVNI